jgi:quercetin dioxygenase-like cupin family protein
MKMKISRPMKLALLFTLFLAPICRAEDISERTPTNVPATDLKWLPTPVGAMASPVRGDFTQGAHITYLKFRAGAKTAAHTHTADYVGIVLSGRMRHEAKGAPETMRVLGAGSHWSMPGDAEHVSECLPGEDCMLVIIQEEKFDFLPLKKPE